MANQNAPFGLRPIGKIGQNRDNQGLSEYSIKANDTTSIFFQDVVNATADGTVHLGAASEAFMVGSLNGVFYTDPTTSKPTFRNNYAQVNASDIVAFVADDPYERFEVQSDNTLASAQTDVFMNYNLNVNPTTPSAANNVSTTQLDDSTVTTGTAQIKVTGVSTDIKNNDLSASHVNFVVMINEHLYNAKNNGI
tara:strand:+ start:178 stop:759 length:582 start_codon:yes stop_codon:yes gene_type:complete